jgi:hypothetical protein
VNLEMHHLNKYQVHQAIWTNLFEPHHNA